VAASPVFNSSLASITFKNIRAACLHPPDNTWALLWSAWINHSFIFSGANDRAGVLSRVEDKPYVRPSKPFVFMLWYITKSVRRRNGYFAELFFGIGHKL
jgi:hypothetical protein